MKKARGEKYVVSMERRKTKEVAKWLSKLYVITIF